MLTVLLKAFSFVFIIALGYSLKKIGLFDSESYRVPMKIVLNITLPAAVITSFSSTEVRPSLALLAVLGFALNCIILLFALLISRNKATDMRAAWINTIPGYNIGAFVLPFVQAFLPAEGAIACCVLDAGSAVMCTGGTYAISCSLLGQEKISLRMIGKRLLSSRPFLCYTGMLLLSLAGFRFPAPVLSFIAPIANANPFLAMLMVGMMLEFRFPREVQKEIFSMVAVRLLYGILAAAACAAWIPGIYGKAAALAVMGPVSVAATAFAEKAGAKPEVVACVNSLTILLSIIALTLLVLLFGL